jgi:murein DD-endopeptidase MepM/ murein hydrolase activator NlpD
MSTSKTLAAVAVAGTLVLGLQASAQARPASSSTRLAVVDTVNAGQGHSPKAAKKELAAAATITVTVAPGDSLSALAARHCGNGSWAGLYEDNKSVVGVDPNLIYPGQKLVINCATGTAATAAAPAPATAPAAVPASSGWVRPINACVGSGFGWRWGAMHNGVDLAAGSGTPIRAAAAGTVSTAWQAGGAGNYTMINHGGGTFTVYMHQSSFAVQSGWVDAGQTIGYVGSTGNSTGPHLHFEVHTGGLWNNRVDPVPFMSARGAGLGC